MPHKRAAFPMLVTEFGMLIDARPLQPWKALSPIVVTELGMLTDVRPLHW